jgi:hypothetical protein
MQNNIYNFLYFFTTSNSSTLFFNEGIPHYLLFYINENKKGCCLSKYPILYKYQITYVKRGVDNGR